MGVISASAARSGKSHQDENFPVASRLISPRLRVPILAFYRFVRAADDVADHPTLSPDEKLELLDRLEAALTGTGAPDAEAEPLRLALAAHGLSPRHALDLLQAFRLDARKNRYSDWSDLMGYCALSAMPVGRFVLDVHGESSQVTWPASDAICAALQIINHLQDCGKDFRELDRVYLPLDLMDEHGTRVEDLAAPRASPALKAVIAGLALRTKDLLHEGEALPLLVADTRLALEVSAIHRLAAILAEGLEQRDPLSQKVHLGKVRFAAVATGSAVALLLRRTFRRRPAALALGTRGR